jgi:hypothetical protein
MAWAEMAYHLKKWDDEFHSRLRPGRLRRYWVELVNTFASIVTLVMFVILLAKPEQPTFWYVILLISYLGVAILIVFVQHWIYARKARYAEAIRIFHPICHMIRDAMHKIDELGESDFKLALTKILDALAATF